MTTALYVFSAALLALMTALIDVIRSLGARHPSSMFVPGCVVVDIFSWSAAVTDVFFGVAVGV